MVTARVRRVSFPVSTTWKASMRVNPPRSSIHAPERPKAYSRQQMIMVPLMSTQEDMSAIPSAHHGSRRPARK